MDKYAVFGNPIAHSKSPQIHRAFAKQFNEQIEYNKILSSPAQFFETIKGFFAHGAKGANVTLPFKEQAFQLADQHTARAVGAQAVNTLAIQQDGSLLGDNTDGIGLVADIHQQGIKLTGKHILLLGAGGAAKGVLHPLLAQQPKRITIANRTASKAITLAKQAQQWGEVSGVGLNQLKKSAYQLVINSTSSSVNNALPDLDAQHLQDCELAYDMFYSDQQTVFMQWAAQHSQAKTSDGLGMLVEQAACAYQLWRGKMPNTQQILQALRKGELT